MSCKLSHDKRSVSCWMSRTTHLHWLAARALELLPGGRTTMPNVTIMRHDVRHFSTEHHARAFSAADVHEGLIEGISNVEAGHYQMSVSPAAADKIPFRSLGRT